MPMFWRCRNLQRKIRLRGFILVVQVFIQNFVRIGKLGYEGGFLKLRIEGEKNQYIFIYFAFCM